VAVAVLLPASASAWRLQGAGGMFQFDGVRRQADTVSLRKCGGSKFGAYTLHIHRMFMNGAVDGREFRVDDLTVVFPVSRKIRSSRTEDYSMNFGEWMFGRNEERRIAKALAGFYERLGVQLSKDGTELLIHHHALRFPGHRVLKQGVARFPFNPPGVADTRTIGDGLTLPAPGASGAARP
jgi:hypothetical protein